MSQWRLPQQGPIPTPRPMMAQAPGAAAGAQQRRGFLDMARENPEFFLQLGAGLLGGQTGPEQWSMGLSGASQALSQAKERKREREQKNATLEWLRAKAPDYAAAVEAGVMSPADAYKLQAQSGRAQLPEPTAAMREYEFAKSQGYDGSFMDFQGGLKKAGAMNINMPSAPTIGSIPQGFQAIQDPMTGGYRMERIPGGPEDQTAANAAQLKQDAQKATVARSAIQSIKSKLDSGGLPAVGVIGSRLTGINQEAADVKNQLATLQSIVSFDRLQAMREASPTGGALGAVSERELALLQASLGALSQDSSEADIRQTLDFIDGIMAKFEAYPGGIQGSAPAGTAPTGATSSGIKWSVVE